MKHIHPYPSSSNKLPCSLCQDPQVVVRLEREESMSVIEPSLYPRPVREYLSLGLMPQRRISIGVADRIPANNLQLITLFEKPVDFRLIRRRRQAVPGNPRRTALLFPNRRVVIDATNTVPADLSESVSLTDEAVELLLVSGRRETMARHPRAVVAGLFPDSRVAGLAADGVTADMPEAISFALELIERALVIRRTQAMPRDPCAGWRFIPNGHVTILTIHGVSVHQDRSVSLTGILVENLLILGRCQARS